MKVVLRQQFVSLIPFRAMSIRLDLEPAAMLTFMCYIVRNGPNVLGRHFPVCYNLPLEPANS